MHGSIWTYNGKGGRHRVLTRVEFQEMIYPYLICIINGLRGRRKKGRGMGKGKK